MSSSIGEYTNAAAMSNNLGVLVAEKANKVRAIASGAVPAKTSVAVAERELLRHTSGVLHLGVNWLVSKSIPLVVPSAVVDPAHWGAE